MFDHERNLVEKAKASSITINCRSIDLQGSQEESYFGSGTATIQAV
jgi:hypothetical protein